ncbi:hypothetical protein [Cryocola sp. 340MFSha3.1]|uniref:hypothetical protein n=1 Tax=Cryocola sp. 340MFSha3.1 TaxID=1169145 RepID=UPI0003811FD4|nr:hypothetical protein [Cryocola sp. 340MFSha3.1]
MLTLDERITVIRDKDTGEYVALAEGQPYLSWVEPTREAAIEGMRRLLADIDAGRA